MRTVEFGSLFQFIRNGMNVRQDKSGEGLPITRIETISDAEVDGSRVGFAGLGETDCRDWLMETGDILFSHINSVEHVGKCAVYRGSPEKLIHGMNLLCLRSDRGQLLPEYAKYLIRGRAFRSRLSSFINRAVNQASVSIGNLKTIPVSVPSLPEQRMIAEILDKADALRAKRRAALAQLDTLTQSIFLDMFGDPVTNPKEWPVRRLSNALDEAEVFVDGDWVESKDQDSQGDVRLIQLADVGDGAYLNKSARFMTVAAARRLKCTPLKVGDVLVARMPDPLGRACLFPGDRREAVTVVDVCIIRPAKNGPDATWLMSAINTPSFRRLIDRQATGTTRERISRGNLAALSLSWPPIEMQREFARRAEQTAEFRATHRAALNKLGTLFASLQHHAFRGEL